MPDYVESANAAIAAIEAAAERLARACADEMELEDERPIVKAAAVRRIMERDGLAATPAEKIVETDAEYAAHRRRQYAAVVEVQRARGEFEAAKRRADVAIDMGMLLSSSADVVEPKVGEIRYDARAIIKSLADYKDTVLGPNIPTSAVLDL